MCRGNTERSGPDPWTFCQDMYGWGRHLINIGWHRHGSGQDLFRNCRKSCRTGQHTHVFCRNMYGTSSDQCTNCAIMYGMDHDINGIRGMSYQIPVFLC